MTLRTGDIVRVQILGARHTAVVLELAAHASPPYASHHGIKLACDGECFWCGAGADQVVDVLDVDAVPMEVVR